MKRQFKYIFLICWLISSTFLAFAQKFQVTGTVADTETGDIIPGVNVLVKGTNQGTVTNSEGSYQIYIDDEQVLAFSSVGYLSQEITPGSRRIVNISLAPEVRNLEEVIVTGYSVESRRQVTGAVATVEPKDLAITPTGNVEQMLQGRVSGLTVITNGQPGTASQVRVHGYGALQGNEPLYVVDGVPTESIDFIAPGDIESMTVLKDAPAASIYGSRAAGGVIVIETHKGNRAQNSMRITYDGMVGVAVPGKPPQLLGPQEQADWTWKAIQNAASQNGTVPDFSRYEIPYGSEASPVLPDWLRVGSNAGHQVGDVDLKEEAENYDIDFSDGQLYLVVPSNKSGTRWYQAITHNALVHRHQIGLSGGGLGNQYYVGLAAQEQEGTFLYQKFQKYSLRFNSDFKLLPGLRLGENIQVTYQDRRNIRGNDGGAGSADGMGTNDVRVAYMISPIIPVHDAFGGYGGSSGVPGIAGNNPVAKLTRDRNNQDQNTSIFGNLFLEYQPLEGLTARSSFGGQYFSHQGLAYFPPSYENPQSVQVFFYAQESSWQSQWVWNNTLNYHFEPTPGHSIDMLLGQEVLNTGTFRDIAGTGTDPFSESTDFVNLNTVGNRSVQGSHSNGINFSSFFGKANYDFRNKYQVTLVIRRDGSSRFGENKRWGTFPALSAGWRISEEPFFRGATMVDDLRIRIGYGEMGNSNNVDPINQFDLFTSSIVLSSYDIKGTNSSAVQGFNRNKIGNPSSTWETVVTRNLGLDASFWDGKLDLSVDIWRQDTKDFLYQFPITIQTGFNAVRPFVNVGEMSNQGVDIRLRSSGTIASNLHYQITINGSFLKNELISLGQGIMSLPEFSNLYFIRPINFDEGIVPVLNLVGHPLSSFYGYKVQKLFSNEEEVSNAALQDGAAPGRFRFKDINGDGVISPEDRTVIGSPIADFTGGIYMFLNYRNFELQMYGYTSIGNEIYNIQKRSTDFFDPNGTAISSSIKNSWSFEEPTGSIPIFEDTFNFSTNTQSHSYFVEDGSYFRMQNITLAYNFEANLGERWGISTLRVSAAVNNLFTITSYSGLDPAVGGNLDHNFGIDGGNYPINTSWTLGVSLGF